MPPSGKSAHQVQHRPFDPAPGQRWHVKRNALRFTANAFGARGLQLWCPSFRSGRFSSPSQETDELLSKFKGFLWSDCHQVSSITVGAAHENSHETTTLRREIPF
jgi:hypothetical protein